MARTPTRSRLAHQRMGAARATRLLLLYALVLAALLAGASAARAVVPPLPAPPPLSFVGPQALTTGAAPQAIAAADFNKDGRTDVVTADNGAGSVTVELSNASGGFDRHDYAVGTNPVAVTVADFNGDGKSDVATANGSSPAGTVSVLLNNGSGGFGAASTLTLGGGSVGDIVSGDFNGDGKADLAVASLIEGDPGGYGVEVFYGNGSGGFGAAQVHYDIDDHAADHLAVGDLNKDGKSDLVFDNTAANSITVLPGNAAGTFGAASTFNLVSGPSPLAVADLNSDGWLDVVVTHANDNQVSVLLNDKAGGFSQVLYNAYYQASAVTTGDLNGDGLPDIALYSGGNEGLTPKLSVLLRIKGGGFATYVDYTVPYGNPVTLASGDFNGDAFTDLASANATTNGVALMAGDGSGGLAASYVVGNGPRSVVAADFDKDGKLDLTTADNGSNTASLLGGNGSGGFNLFGSLAMGTGPVSAVPCDVNGDGNLDLVTVNNGSNNVSVRLGNGAGGSFAAPTSVAVANSPQQGATADFNKDGKADLAVATAGSWNVSIVSGSATTPTVTNYSVQSPHYAVAVGDVNGDGSKDVVVTDYANAGTAYVSVLLNNGSGGFTTQLDSVTSGLTSIALADVNSDGKLDLLGACAGSSTVVVALGDGSGHFAAPTSYAVGSYPRSIVTGDFNGDGKLDLAVADSGSASTPSSWTVSILLGDATGHFGFGVLATHAEFPVGASPTALTTGDFNRDGRLDLAVTNGTNLVSVLLNTTPPRISVTSPTGASVWPSGSTQTVKWTLSAAEGFGEFYVYLKNAAGTVCASKSVAAVAGLKSYSTTLAMNASPASGYKVSVYWRPRVATGTWLASGASAAFLVSVSFAAHADHAVGTSPYSVAVGDFNGDGSADLASANSTSNNVSLLLGDGSGGFAAHVEYAVGSGPRSVAVGDFNRDGKQDLATANFGSKNVSLLLGDGKGGFAAHVDYAVGSQPRSVAVGDFNGDGKLDLATANYSSNNLSVLLGDGKGGFAAHTEYAVASGPFSVAVGDFNGDGKADLAAASSSWTVSVLLGDGKGGFAAHVDHAVGGSPNSVAVGDFNGDGKADLATPNYNSNNVSLLLGDGMGGFATHVEYAVGTSPAWVAVGDFNGDGKADLATANLGSNNVSLLLGDGKAGFAAHCDYAAGTWPASVAVGDFNGDGKTDLATANGSSNNASVLLNTSVITLPKITITAPAAGASWAHGSTQTVTWTLSKPVYGGELRVWLVSSATATPPNHWYISKAVKPLVGQTSYSTQITVSVPAAGGYKAYVYWRLDPLVSHWVVRGYGAAFTVTP